jgi:hypothetical protein
MEIIISEQQLQKFLKRRFSAYELMWILKNVKQLIDEGENADDAVYGEIRNLIANKKFSDINNFGTEESYWDSYLKYETPLVAFIKSELGLE